MSSVCERMCVVIPVANLERSFGPFKDKNILLYKTFINAIYNLDIAYKIV